MGDNLKKSSYKIILFAVLTYTIHLLIALIGIAYYKLNGFGRWAETSWSSIFIETILLNWILMIIMISIIVFITKEIYQRDISWKRAIVFHLFFFIICSVLLTIIYVFELAIIGKINLSDFDIKYTFGRYLIDLDDNFLRYMIYASIAYIYFYWKINLKNKLEYSRLQTQLANTKMSVLKSQLQPHFLFNTMNSIYSLMDKNIEKSKLMLVDLSDLLRELIDNKDENLIELKDEMSLVQKYLDIVKIRFSDDFNVEVSVSNDLEHILIPSMLLQPIIENSIKHGYSDKNKELSLSLSLIKEKSTVVIIVKNNGKFLDKPFNELIDNGLGVKNTIERLKTLYGDNFSYEMYNSEIGVTTEIIIPYQLAEFELVEEF